MRASHSGRCWTVGAEALFGGVSIGRPCPVPVPVRGPWDLGEGPLFVHAQTIAGGGPCFQRFGSPRSPAKSRFGLPSQVGWRPLHPRPRQLSTSKHPMP